MFYKVLGLYLLFSTAGCLGLKIDRVILSTNENPMYIEFWPLVANAWSQLIGFRPTLALVADENTHVDYSLGDVIRIQPIPGIPTSLHAQVIRLLLPIYFEDETCIISDIDMIPISKDYFVNSVKDIPDDHFVIYRDHGYGKKSRRFPMCYSAAKGKTFKEIFKIKSIEDIPNKVIEWSKLKHGWATDEFVLCQAIYKWNLFKSKCTRLHHTSMLPQRIDRSDWKYDKNKLKEGYYIDAHMLRPLSTFIHEIQELAQDLGILF